jgi:hypothetical protein
MARSSLRYVLPFAGLLVMAAPAAAAPTVGGHTIADFVNMEGATNQIMYLRGLYEGVATMYAIRCPDNGGMTTQAVRSLLYAELKLGLVSRLRHELVWRRGARWSACSSDRHNPGQASISSKSKA